MSEERKQVGTKLDAGLYRQIRALAILQGKEAGQLIDDAIRAYLAAQMAQPKIEVKRSKGAHK